MQANRLLWFPAFEVNWKTYVQSFKQNIATALAADGHQQINSMRFAKTLGFPVRAHQNTNQSKDKRVPTEKIEYQIY